MRGLKFLTPIFFVLLFNINFAMAGEVSKFVFTTDPQTIRPEIVSGKITISSQDAGGNSAEILQTACVDLSSSGSGEFSSSNTNWSAVNKLTISKNSSNRSFYYKGHDIGKQTITAKIAFRPDTVTDACTKWPIEEWNIKYTITQEIIISSDAGSSTGQTSQLASSFTSGSSSLSDFPIEPQIYADAGPDRTVIVGAEEKFTGQSSGLKKEPLQGTRYLWSFGDGLTGEGQSVLHNYKYPGDYITVLNVTSGKYTAADRANIKALPSPLKISEINSEFIKISNDSGGEIEISNWLLASGGVYFRFPEATLLNPKGEVIIANSTSGIKIGSSRDLVELLYPNASVAFKYEGPGAREAVSKQAVKSAAKSASGSSGGVVARGAGPEAIANELPAEGAKAGAEQNLAGVIYAGKKDNNLSDWLLPTAGMGLLAALGYVFIKNKQKREEAPAAEKQDTFSIDEESF